MKSLQGIRAAVRVALALSALAALGWWGADLGRSTLGSLVLAIGLPALAAVTWGNFAAPGAPQRLAPAGRLVVELLLYGTATTGLAAMGHWLLASGMGLAAGLGAGFALLWRHDDAMRSATAH